MRMEVERIRMIEKNKLEKVMPKMKKFLLDFSLINPINILDALSQRGDE